MGVNDYY